MSLIQVGPRGSQVKALVKMGCVEGGELNDAKRGVVGPQRWSENHHKGGGVGVQLLRQSTADWIFSQTQRLKIEHKLEPAQT